MCSPQITETFFLLFRQRCKFIIESCGSKKNIFVTETSKIAKYLCNLCSAQHKFSNEMNSRQLSRSLASGQLLICPKPRAVKLKRRLIVLFLHTFAPPDENIVQYAAARRAQAARPKSFSCSETPQGDSGLTTPQGESLTKLCEDVAARIEARIKQQRFNNHRYKGGGSKLSSSSLRIFKL